KPLYLELTPRLTDISHSFLAAVLLLPQKKGFQKRRKTKPLTKKVRTFNFSLLFGSLMVSQSTDRALRIVQSPRALASRFIQLRISESFVTLKFYFEFG